MKERPILFSGPLVRAILDGTKTQTRRLLNPQPAAGVRRSQLVPSGFEDGHGREIRVKYRPGERLWVREAFHHCPHCESGFVAYKACGFKRAPSGAPDDDGDWSQNDDSALPPKHAAHGWKLSIHMPRAFSRIDLEIVEVRIQRLHELTEEDARAEGVLSDDISKVGVPCYSARQNFARLWDEINGARASWDSDPWVFAISFRRVRP